MTVCATFPIAGPVLFFFGPGVIFAFPAGADARSTGRESRQRILRCSLAAVFGPLKRFFGSFMPAPNKKKKTKRSARTYAGRS